MAWRLGDHDEVESLSIDHTGHSEFSWGPIFAALRVGFGQVFIRSRGPFLSRGNFVGRGPFHRGKAGLQSIPD